MQNSASTGFVLAIAIVQGTSTGTAALHSLTIEQLQICAVICWTNTRQNRNFIDNGRADLAYLMKIGTVPSKHCQ